MYNLEKEIKKHIKDLHDATTNVSSIKQIMKHDIAERIYIHGLEMFKPIYEVIDEYPIVCLALVGEMIRIGVIDNFFDDIYRGNIPAMAKEYREFYERKLR